MTTLDDERAEQDSQAFSAVLRQHAGRGAVSTEPHEQGAQDGATASARPDYGAGARPGPQQPPTMNDLLRAQWRGKAG
jgi:hypothetical protein